MHTVACHVKVRQTTSSSSREGKIRCDSGWAALETALLTGTNATYSGVPRTHPVYVSEVDSPISAQSVDVVIGRSDVDVRAARTGHKLPDGRVCVEAPLKPAIAC
eukprot:35213-Eustigmatos_ZCMA.PRE.1